MLIVVSMFTVLWSVGPLLLLLACLWRKWNKAAVKTRQRTNLEQKKLVAQRTKSPVAVRAYLLDYVTEVFPAVFSNKPFFARILDEVKLHHRYFRLFVEARVGKSSDNAYFLSGVKLLCVQTTLMFIIALLYDLQFPTDDGSCEDHATEMDCLGRKRPLDATQSYCRWNSDDSTQSREFLCEYNSPEELSVKVALYIVILVALCVALCVKPIDFVFSVLAAPRAQTVVRGIVNSNSSSSDENNNIDYWATRSLGGGIIRAAQHIVGVSAHVTTAAKARLASSVFSLRSLHGGGGGGEREVRHSTDTAHTLAATSMSNFMKMSLSSLQAVQAQRRRMQAYHSRPEGSTGRGGLPNGSLDLAATDLGVDAEWDASSMSNLSPINSVGSDYSKSPKQRRHSFFNEHMGDVVVDTGEQPSGDCGLGAEMMRVPDCGEQGLGVGTATRFDCLVEQIYCQRRMLKLSEIEEFDLQWGLTQAGEFASVGPSQRGAWGCSRQQQHRGSTQGLDTAECIRQEVNFVSKFSVRKTEVLRWTSSRHTGLEILHLFIMDLLGRNTPAARVFETKVEADFKHTRAYSLRSKVFRGDFYRYSERILCILRCPAWLPSWGGVAARLSSGLCCTVLCRDCTF